MIDLREIHSFTDFQRNAKEYVGKLKGSKTPLVLTINGRAELVVQDAASYQELLDELEHVKFVAAVKEGLEDSRAGRVRPAFEALAELDEKHGLRR